MGRITVLDPTAEAGDLHAAGDATGTTWRPPRLDRPLAGCTIGLRLDRSWPSYDVVVDVWTELLRADGARVERLVVDGRVARAGAQVRNDLAAWRTLVDAAVVGLGN